MNRIISTMSRLNVFALIIVLFSLPFYSKEFPGKPWGMFFHNYYNAENYDADPQNWGAVQDHRGIMYFANGSGILEFDGKNWTLTELPRRGTVRCVRQDIDGRLLVGAQKELGFIVFNHLGHPSFVSLLNQLKDEDRDFSDIWEIHTTSDGVYFVSSEKLFFLDRRAPKDDKMKSIKLSRNFFSFQIGESIYVVQQGKPVGLLNRMQLIPLPNCQSITPDTCGNIFVLPYPPNKLLFLTEYKGLYVYEPVFSFRVKDKPYPTSGILTHLSTDYEKIHPSPYVIDAIPLDRGRYALSISDYGILIIDTNGRILNTITKSQGLADSTVNKLYTDRDHHLWCCTNRGLNMFQVDSPISFFGDTLGIDGMGLSAQFFKNRLYVGTYTNIFYLENKGQYPGKWEFKELNGYGKNEWCFDLYNGGDYLLGAGLGIYQIAGEQAEKILHLSSPILCFGNSTRFKDYVFLGLDQGLACVKIERQNQLPGRSKDSIGSSASVSVKAVLLEPENLKMFDNDVIRNMACDAEGNMWLVSSGRGLILMHFKSDHITDFDIYRYDSSKGLPPMDSNFISFSQNRLLVINKMGLYTTSPITQNLDINSTGTLSIPEKFFTITTFDKIVGPGNSVTAGFIDKAGEIWLSTKKGLGKLETNINGSFKWNTIPYKNIPRIPYVYITPDNARWFCGDRGIFRYDPQIKMNVASHFNTLIRKVTTAPNDLVIDGAFVQKSSPIIDHKFYVKTQVGQDKTDREIISYKNNSVAFEFSSTYFLQPGNILYRHRLDGLEESWSKWTTEKRLEYTNLPPGEYQLRIVAKNIYETEGMETRYRFIILPPWYGTIAAYIIYFLLALWGGYKGIKLYSRRLINATIRLEATIKERTEEIREQREEIAAQAEQLKNQNEELVTIDNIAKVLNLEVAFEDLLKTMLNEVLVFKGVEKSAALVFDKASRTFSIKAAVGVGKEELNRIHVMYEESLDILISNTVEIFPGFFTLNKICCDGTTGWLDLFLVKNSMLIMRIAVGDQIAGYLLFSPLKMKEDKTLDEKDARLLNRLKDHITIAFIKNKLVLDLQNERKFAETANHAKSLFLARMSHEIRTPINGVLGFADMLLDTNMNELQREYISTIIRSGEALLSIINDILDLSKIEAGQLTFEQIDFDLEVMAFDICYLMMPRLSSKPIEILCHIADNVPAYVKGDPGRVRQVLVNLMGNAVKFTEKGEIELSVSIEAETRDELKIHTKIRDTGIGIPSNKIDSIFELFQQADGSTTRKYGGTGLGLAICRQLAEMMKGTVWVESEEGIGSTFHFSAWLRKSDKIPVLKHSPQLLQNKRILIADDNPGNLHIVSYIVQKYQMRVVEVGVSTQIIATFERCLAENDPVEICILDIQMPEVNGFEVVRKIRAHSDSRVSSIPVLALSSSTEKHTQYYRKAGFSGYLAKPVHRTRLIAMLKRLLSGEEDEQKNLEEKIDIVTRHSLIEEAKQSVCILLVEDNEINLKLAKYLLNKGGYAVEDARSGKEAVEKVTANPTRYGLIFMDIHMPEMDGLEATRVLREKGFTDIPIVAMTADAMKEDRGKSIDAGMNDYVAKPINREIVYKMINKWALKEI